MLKTAWGTPQGLRETGGGGRQRQSVLTEVVLDFVEDVGEGWSSLHQGVT